MKKLMILMLVFGLASLANAALTGIQLSVDGVTDGDGNTTNIEVEQCTEVVIDVHGPYDYDYLGYVIIESDYPTLAGGEWGDTGGTKAGYYYADGYPVKHAGAGDDELSNIKRYTEDGWGYGYEISANSATQVPGGLQFEILYHCTGPNSEYVTITLWDEAEGYDTPQDTIVIHQTPEPMTVALLGLGGLLLRRRK